MMVLGVMSGPLVEALELAEWPPSEIDGEPGCQCCGNLKIQGHDEDCVYGNFLTDIRSGKLMVVDGERLEEVYPIWASAISKRLGPDEYVLNFEQFVAYLCREEEVSES